MWISGIMHHHRLTLKCLRALNASLAKHNILMESNGQRWCKHCPLAKLPTLQGCEFVNVGAGVIQHHLLWVAPNQYQLFTASSNLVVSYCLALLSRT